MATSTLDGGPANLPAGRGLPPLTRGYTAHEGARTVDYAPPPLHPTASRAYYFYLMLPAVLVLAAISL